VLNESRHPRAKDWYHCITLGRLQLRHEPIFMPSATMHRVYSVDLNELTSNNVGED
jgi:hypothetical protein